MNFIFSAESNIIRMDSKMSQRVTRAKRRLEADANGFNDGNVATKRQKTVNRPDIEQMAINGLLNVHNRSKKRAADVFNRNYGKQLILLTMHSMPDMRPRPLSKKTLQFKVIAKIMDDNKMAPVDPVDPIDAQKLLKNFGRWISKLKIDYSQMNEDTDSLVWKFIEELIIEQCSDSLTDLTLQCNKGDAFEMLENPLQTLERLTIENCVLTSKMLPLATFSPNLQQLTVDCRGLDEYSRFKNDCVESLDLLEKVKHIG